MLQKHVYMKIYLYQYFGIFNLYFIVENKLKVKNKLKRILHICTALDNVITYFSINYSSN